MKRHKADKHDGHGKALENNRRIENFYCNSLKKLYLRHDTWMNLQRSFSA